MKHFNKIWMYACGLALVLTAFPGNALAETKEPKETISIGSVQDWEAFAANCTLDTWSQDKMVVLEQDLDLTGVEIHPVPTFGGVFDGNGHHIQGVDLDADQPVYGLFRYVQESGTIKNLSVSVSVIGNDGNERIGGLAGENNGTIENCQISAYIQGEGCIGGIAGRNNAMGVIRGGRVEGRITGDRMAGGIAGENHGSILSCTNQSSINVTARETSVNLDNIRLDIQEQGSDSAKSFSDIGGIVGYNRGTIETCENYGFVGYPHMGYNIGGIAGRQSGKIWNSQNFGKIYGRKDVGGITGQMEPDIVLHYSQDTLQKLQQELDGLDTKVNQALDTVDSTDTMMTARLEAISNSINAAKEDAKGMLDHGLDELDDLVSWAQSSMRSAGDVIWELEEGEERFQDVLTEIRDFLEHLKGNGDPEQNQDTQNALDALEQALDQWKQAKTQVQDAQNALKAALQSGDREQIMTATSQFAASLQYLAESGVALKIEIENLKESLKDLDAGDLINKEGILNALDDFGSSLSGAVGRLDDLGNGLYDDSDQLDASLSELSGQMDLLRGEMQDSSQTLREDVRGITDQFQNIFQVLTDAADTEREEPALTQDVSDQDLYKAVDGKVWECSNFGAVDGDLNVGGITGTMAVEVSLDPEDDIMEEGENSFDFQYQTKAILLTCINEGPVQAKKNYAGGIVGRMNVGTVQECEDYGEVRSESGSYVGGIAGFSGSVIRNSFAKVLLQGEDQVGGIAGKGTRISGCYGFVELSDAAGQMGAIAGAMDEEEPLLEENYFVDTGWAGIGGISYGGKAEPIDYETLQTLEGVPEKFLKVTLTFLADGQLLSQVEIPFGGSADSLELPEIPEKDGYYGVWPDFKKTDIRYSQTIEADYRPWLTVISSKEGTDVDGKRLAYGLAEGVFRESDVLHVTSAQVDAPKDSGEQDSRAIWEVRLEQEEGMSDAYEISLRKPDGKGTLKVWGFQDQWTEIPYEDSKSYVTVSMKGNKGVFCISYVPDRLWIVVAAGAAAAGIGVFVIFKKRRGRRKNSVDL